MNIKHTSTTPMQNFTPAAKPDAETLKLAQTINDGLDKIEEIPDFKTRQEETLKLLVKAKSQSQNPEVKDLLRLSEVNVHAHETVYSAMKIGRITHQALLNGSYGSAPLLAATAGKMFDTLQFGPRKTVSERLLKEMMRRTDDPAATEAYQMAKDVQDKIFSDYTGRNSIGVTKEVLASVANGFDGSPEEVMKLAKSLTQSAFEKDFHASKLMAIMPHLLKAVPDKATKAKLKFAWKIAEKMKGEKAEEYLGSLLKNAESIPSGDAGRIGMVKDSLQFYRKREQLSAASTNILKELTLKASTPNLKKIFSLAGKINNSISPDLSAFDVDEDAIPDTSDLVRKTLDYASENTPLDSDQAVLSFTRDLVGATSGNSSSSNKKICEVLIKEVENPECRKILEFTSKISPKNSDSEILLAGIDAARDALEGRHVDLTEVGQKMAESFPSVYSGVDAFHSLFQFMSSNTDYQNMTNILNMGVAATKDTYSGPETKMILSGNILQKIRDGATDKNTDPIEFCREIAHIPSSADTRFNVIDNIGKELLNQIKEPEAKEFFTLANEFVHNFADYDYSVKAFDTALDKAQELKGGKKFHLINDSLDVINSVPDKLIQANMLRKLDMKYCSQMVGQKVLSETIEGPLEDLSALGDSSTERLQIALDFLNLLSSNARNPQGTYDILTQVYDKFPDRLKDIAAVSFFHFLRTDPGSNNTSKIRNYYIKPEEWKAVGDTITAAQNEKDDFKFVKDALVAVSSFKEGTPGGAISFVVLKEMEKRAGNNAGMRLIMNRYRRECENSKGRLSSAPAEDALCQVGRLMLNNLAVRNPQLRLPVQSMETLWKDGDAEHNKKLLVETLGDMDRFQKGEIKSNMEWVTEKILGGSEDASQPAKKIVSNDDYVIIGGVILPKRK